MALPKLNTPTYELELPSTGEKIKYRPFLVKEQKILMMAQEGSDENEIAEAMGNLVSDCTFGKIDAKVSPMFDIEYIFLKVRGKSVGDKIELNVTCPDDEETSAPVTIDIEEIQVHMLEDHTNEVNISDDIKVVLRYPVLSDMKNVKASSNSVDRVFNVLNSCITSIHFGDDVYNKVDLTEKDINEFVDQFTSEQFDTMVKFFDTMPKMRHIVNVTNPKTKVTSEVVLEGLESFLE
tara:strand:- start:2357 stop:3064 length:708 start_codon:yes stop_codon:yes gene_type:complete